jgi:hypothetical protein
MLDDVVAGVRRCKPVGPDDGAHFVYAAIDPVSEGGER